MFQKVEFENGEYIYCCNIDCKSALCANQCRTCGFEQKENARRKALPFQTDSNGRRFKNVSRPLPVYVRG